MLDLKRAELNEEYCSWIIRREVEGNNYEVLAQVLQVVF